MCVKEDNEDKTHILKNVWHLFGPFYNKATKNTATGLFGLIFNLVRGVLGNKCAGHHNLKTVKIRELMCK